MHEQASAQTQMLSEYEKEEILQKRQRAVESLIDTMIPTLPIMAQIALNPMRSSVSRFIDEMTYEQTEYIISEIEKILEGLKG